MLSLDLSQILPPKMPFFVRQKVRIAPLSSDFVKN